MSLTSGMDSCSYVPRKVAQMIRFTDVSNVSVHLDSFTT